MPFAIIKNHFKRSRQSASQLAKQTNTILTFTASLQNNAVALPIFTLQQIILY